MATIQAGRPSQEKLSRQDTIDPTPSGMLNNLQRSAVNPRSTTPQSHTVRQRSYSPSLAMTVCLMGNQFGQPLPVRKGGVKHIIVAVYYFIKWVEAEPHATITSKVETRFLWKNIASIFGIPNNIVDNGRQFDSKHYREWCRELAIQLKYSSPWQRTSIINKKIPASDTKGEWVEELPGVLWAYRTTVKTPMSETPFTLAFRSEAVDLVEVGLPKHRTSH